MAKKSGFPTFPKEVIRSFSVPLRPGTPAAAAALARTTQVFRAEAFRLMTFLKAERDAKTAFWKAVGAVDASTAGTHLAPYFMRAAEPTGTTGESPDAKKSAAAKKAAADHPGLPLAGWSLLPQKFVAGVIRQVLAAMKSWDKADERTRQEYAELTAKAEKTAAAVPAGEAARFKDWLSAFEGEHDFRFNARFADVLLGIDSRRSRHPTQFDDLARGQVEALFPASLADEDGVRRLVEYAELLRKLVVRKEQADWPFASPESMSALRLPFCQNTLGFRLFGDEVRSVSLELLTPDGGKGEFPFAAYRTGYLGPAGGHRVEPLVPGAAAPDAAEDVKRKKRTLVPSKNAARPPLGATYRLTFRRGRKSARYDLGGLVSDLAVAVGPGGAARAFFAYKAEAPFEPGVFRDPKHVDEVTRRMVSGLGRQVGESPPPGVRVMSVDLGVNPVATWVVCQDGPTEANLVAKGAIAGDYLDADRKARVEAIKAACLDFKSVRDAANGADLSDDRRALLASRGYDLADPEADLGRASRAVYAAIRPAKLPPPEPGGGREQDRRRWNQMNAGVGRESVEWATWYKVALSCIRSHRFRGKKPLPPGRASRFMRSYSGYLTNYRRNITRQVVSRLMEEAVRHGAHYLVMENLEAYTPDAGRGKAGNKTLEIFTHRQFAAELAHAARCRGIVLVPAHAALTSQLDPVTGRFGYRSAVHKEKLVVERDGRLEVINCDEAACFNLQHTFWTRSSRSSLRLFARPLSGDRFLAVGPDDRKGAEFPLGALADGAVFKEFGTHYPVLAKNCDGYTLEKSSKSEYDGLLGQTGGKGGYFYRHNDRYYPHETHREKVVALCRRACEAGLLDAKLEETRAAMKRRGAAAGKTADRSQTNKKVVVG